MLLNIPVISTKIDVQYINHSNTEPWKRNYTLPHKKEVTTMITSLVKLYDKLK